jgi:hypothetical protein
VGAGLHHASPPFPRLKAAVSHPCRPDRTQTRACTLAVLVGRWILEAGSDLNESIVSLLSLLYRTTRPHAREIA